jgi:hypothetical protein
MFQNPTIEAYNYMPPKMPQCPNDEAYNYMPPRKTDPHLAKGFMPPRPSGHLTLGYPLLSLKVRMNIHC